MLTFTEFFTKKKIDIQAIKNAKPELYQEFERDYDQMGEKSFDHSKKFWFNRLRHQFLLETIEIPKSSQSESQTKESVSSEKSTSKPTGFRPKFKASSQKVPAESQDVQENLDQVRPVEEKKRVTGFKPRFKSATPPEKNDQHLKTESADSTPSQKAATSSKPTGFKPRFKAGVTKSEDRLVDKTETPGTDSKGFSEGATDSKPARAPQGFTPRFKSKQQTGETSDSGKESDSESPVEPKEETQHGSKPTGFKPRFKAGVTKPAPSAESQDENKSLENITDASSENEGTTRAASRPKGFTPRFKAKTVTEPSNSDNQQNDVSQGTKPIEDPEAGAGINKNKPVGFNVKFKKQASSDEQSSKTGEAEGQPTAKSKGQDENSELANDIKLNLEKKPLGFKPRMLQQKKNNSDNDSSGNS